eukprot:GHVP01051377.1.p1 GENE.GHVP01051377.1~~GHVP01051377.1.p1  ORF type:complete len:619 (+),score=84.39 GHVP01051377.1:30-1886(+)
MKFRIGDNTFFMENGFGVLVLPNKFENTHMGICNRYGFCFIKGREDIQTFGIECMVCKRNITGLYNTNVCIHSHFYCCLECCSEKLKCPICAQHGSFFHTCSASSIYERLSNIGVHPLIVDELDLSLSLKFSKYLMVSNEGKVLLDDKNISCLMLQKICSSCNVDIRNRLSIHDKKSGNMAPFGSNTHRSHCFWITSKAKKFRENIRKIGNKSIEIGSYAESVVLADFGIDLLPKFTIKKDHIIIVLDLTASEGIHIEDLLEFEDRGINLGKIIHKIQLYKFAINILPKLRIPEDGILEIMALTADLEGQILPSSLEMDEKSIEVGTIGKGISLKGHAIKLLPKLNFVKNGYTPFILLDTLCEDGFNIEKMDKYSFINTGKAIKNIVIRGHSESLLRLFNLDEENNIENICLSQRIGLEQYEKNLITSPIIFGNITKYLEIEGGALILFPFIRVSQNNYLECLSLSSNSKIPTDNLLHMDDSSINLGRITKEIRLYGYAVNILRLIKIYEDSICCELFLKVWAHEQTSYLLQANDNSIFIGEISEGITISGMAIEVLQKLKWKEETSIPKVTTEYITNNFFDLELYKGIGSFEFRDSNKLFSNEVWWASNFEIDYMRF